MREKSILRAFLIILSVLLLISGCTKPSINHGEKVLVKVGINTPPEITKLNGKYIEIKPNAFIDNLYKVELIVKNSNGEVLEKAQTTDISNITFEITLLPGTYKFEARGYYNDGTVMFTGSTIKEIVHNGSNDVLINTTFENGKIRSTLEIDTTVWENYEVTSASITYQRIATEEVIGPEGVNISGQTTTVEKEVYPGMWSVTFNVSLQSKDPSKYTPESITLEKTVSIEVLPAKIREIKYKIYFEYGLKMSVTVPNTSFPFVIPVSNINAQWNITENKLAISWDYPYDGAKFYIFKEITTDEGEKEYELVGSTENKSYTIENFDQSEYDRISGIAINVYLNEKESGLRVIKKESFQIKKLESVGNIFTTYNVDNNELSINWNYNYNNASFQIFKKNKGNENYELLGQTQSKTFKAILSGKDFWNIEKIVIKAIVNGKESEIAEIMKESINLTSLNIPLISSTMYTLFIRSFYDTNGDGVGDFNGVSQKVSYLKSLGIDTVWFLPFNKSKSYHGYDVEDYYEAESDYGTLEDLDNMIKVLNENGIKVVMDLVVNHTSDNHPWFLDAIENTTNSPYWNYYIMNLQQPSNTNHWHYKINSKGQKVWYFGLFDSSMPDLNYDNPEVLNEVKKIIDFWITMGVDGFRLDAAKHYYGWDWNDGIDSSASVAKTIENYIRTKLGNDAIVVSEVYDGSPDVLTKFAPMPVFNFTFMYNIKQNYEGRDNLLHGSIDWTNPSSYYLNTYHFPFIDSHDLNRFISELVDSKYSGNVQSATKQYLLLNALLLSLNGMPTIYYGNEIGLRGWKWNSYPWDIPVREPMQWYATQNGSGQTYWTKSFYTGIANGNAQNDGAIYDDPNDGISVEEQESGYTILNFFREFINLRKTYPALSFGNETIERDWKNLYVLKKSYGSQQVLVLINLDPTYPNNYEIPAGYTWIWYAFFNGNLFEFGSKDIQISQNTQWTINPRQVYVFVKQ